MILQFSFVSNFEFSFSDLQNLFKKKFENFSKKILIHQIILLFC